MYTIGIQSISLTSKPYPRANHQKTEWIDDIQLTHPPSGLYSQSGSLCIKLEYQSKISS